MTRTVRDPRHLAWKMLTFYALSPATLRRLSLQYGLQECGGFDAAHGTAEPTPLVPWAALATHEPDPRVRMCLDHQAALTQRVAALGSDMQVMLASRPSFRTCRKLTAFVCPACDRALPE